jgi:cephalosporin hydroxylase
MLLLFSLLLTTSHGFVQLIHHRIPSSSSSSFSFQSHRSLRTPPHPHPHQHGNAQAPGDQSQSPVAQTRRDPYGSYYPADITESFIQNHRCKLFEGNSIGVGKSREIPHVEQHDELFREMLQLYDGRNRLHQKQMFMGTRIGQFPFDLQVITEVSSLSVSLTLSQCLFQLLWDVKPDLVIETGTNAGGFSLYLATLLTSWNLNAKILTVDTQPLVRWQKRFGGDLPSDKEAWKKSVVYKEMNSDASEFITTARMMAAGAQRVLVILDRSVPLFISLFSSSFPVSVTPSSFSGHEIKTVWDELLALCVPHVTNSSYCIIEDTVLGTPFDALRIFFTLPHSTDFCIDQDREYFGLSQHRGGYLKRRSVDHKSSVEQKVVDTINSLYKAQVDPAMAGGSGSPAARYRYDRERLEKSVGEALGLRETTPAVAGATSAR